VSELARVRTHRDGPTQLVRITGEVDLSNAHDVIDAVGHAVPDDVTRVVLDLSGTTYMDSAAIATLFRLGERLRDRRQDLRLVVPATSPIRAVIELTRLSHVIPVDEVAPTPGDPSMSYAALPHPATSAPPAGDPPDDLPDADADGDGDGSRQPNA